DAEAGKALYAQYCTTCHGATGHGDGPVAATLNPKPANHADHVFMAGLTDQHLYQVISKGGASVGKSPMMAPWGGVINDQGIKDLIAYLRQLSSTYPAAEIRMMAGHGASPHRFEGRAPPAPVPGRALRRGQEPARQVSARRPRAVEARPESARRAGSAEALQR